MRVSARELRANTRPFAYSKTFCYCSVVRLYIYNRVCRLILNIAPRWRWRGVDKGRGKGSSGGREGKVMK